MSDQPKAEHNTTGEDELLPAPSQSRPGPTYDNPNADEGTTGGQPQETDTDHERE
jgi:hypothetical protein